MDVSGFPHQVGGHFGLLTCAGHVCKPLNQREFAFYQQLHPHLSSFAPKFCGRIRVNLRSSPDGILFMHTDELIQCHDNRQESLYSAENAPTSQASEDEWTQSTSEEQFYDQLEKSELRNAMRMTFRLRNRRVEAESVTNAWAGQCQSKVVQKLVNGYEKMFLLLEDVVSGYVRPCVMDLKMGTRQYGDDASVQKRISQHQKCRQSTSEQMGVRMVGMQLYDKNRREYVYVNKYEGRRMDRVKFASALSLFFRTAGLERSKKVLARLTQLEAAMRQADGFRFFSSSLLVAFDGHPIGPGAVEVRMIDFAHSTFPGFLDDKLYEGSDEGYLLGLSSLCSVVSSVVEVLSHEKSNSGCDLVGKGRKRKLDPLISNDLASLDLAITPVRFETTSLEEEPDISELLDDETS